MAVSYVSSSAANGSSGTPTTATVTAPASITDGDILVAFAFSIDNTGYCAITPPTGFASWGSHEITQTTYRHTEMFWKRCSSESGNYAFTSGNNCDYLLVSMVALRGCLATGDPLDVISNTEYVTSNTTLRAATMTTTVPGGQVWGGRTRQATPSITVPGAFTAAGTTTTEAWRVSTAYRVDEADATWGVTGNQDGTVLESSSKHAMMVSVKAASATFLPRVMTHHFYPPLIGGR
ncbi:MAG: hypothetical protein ABFC80_02830 [Coriobacteriales bacterium]